MIKEHVVKIPFSAGSCALTTALLYCFILFLVEDINDYSIQAKVNVT